MALNYFRSDGWVKTSLGPAVSGAQVYVLNQPANVVPPVTPPRTTPVPFVPNPQALIYSDDGFTPISQPILTDGFGHYDFYVLPGLYTVAIYFGGQLQQYYVDQSIGSVGSTGGTSVLFETNSTPNYNQGTLNLVQGTGITIVSDNFGNVTFSAGSFSKAIQYTIDGGGSAIGTGVKGQLYIPAACTIQGWVITADQTGSAVVDVLTSTYAGFPTTASIAGSNKPTLSSAQKNENFTLSGWGNTAIAAGTLVQFNVNSASTVTRLNITIQVSIP